MAWVELNKTINSRNGLGKLTISVRDDLKRTWSRDSRLDREHKGLTGTTPQLTGKYTKPA